MEYNLFKYKDEYEIIAYQGEVLTTTDSKGEITKAILDPTKKELVEAGYKPLVNTIRPEAKKGMAIEPYYENDKDCIKLCYRFVDLPKAEGEEK